MEYLKYINLDLDDPNANVLNPNGAIWNTCVTDGPASVVVNEASEPGVCDVTIAEPFKGEVSPRLIKTDYIDVPFVQWIT